MFFANATSRQFRAFCNLIGLLIWAVSLTSGTNSLVWGEGSAFRLRPDSKTGRLVQVKVSLDVQGKIADPSRPKPSSVPFAVAARVAYGERMMEQASGAVVARHYANGVAKITVDKAKIDTQLRDQHRLLLISPETRGPDLYSPVGPLTQDELDLLKLPFSSHAVELLLSESDVQLGGQWQPTAETMRQMLLLDSVAECSVNARLEDTKSTAARVRFSGKVRGTSDGSTTSIALNGVMHFDLHAKLVTWLQMKMAENRAAGHLTHGYQATSDFRMQITPAKHLPNLTPQRIALITKQTDPLAGLIALDFPNSGLALTPHQGWHLISDNAEGTILRLIDNGDLIAQANISRLADVQSGHRLSLAEFQNDIQRALAERFGQLELAQEQTDERGRHVAKVVVTGQVKDVPIKWIYHHVTDKQGRRVALLFTLETDLTERFADSDVGLTKSLRLLQRAEDKSANVATRPGVKRGKQVRK